MKNLIENFSKQLTEAVRIGESAVLNHSSAKLTNVLISGLGGSGIGGSIVAEICSSQSEIPIVVNKDYHIPGFVSANTLVIICSYSGNTEETVQAFSDAITKGAKIVCISSGGKIVEIAQKNKIDFILIPSGMPPRACLGYSLTQLFYTLCFFKIISDSFKKQLERSVELIDTEEQNIQKEALIVAQKIHNKLPVIYSASGYEAAAVRFRQQLNENSKELCWHHVLPEMNHNELVGWKTENKNLVVILLRSEDDFERTRNRFEINKKIISQYCSEIIELNSKGSSRLERTIYLVHLCDWISLCLAELKKIDPMEVKVIDFLKGELAKIR